MNCFIPVPTAPRTLIGVLLLLRFTSHLCADTPFSYGANAGWMDFAPTTAARVSASDTHLQGFAYAANFGWIDLGDGTPVNGITYSNAAAADFGVNHDGRGELSGYAYAANIGWINFSWAAPSDANRPRVHLITGAASGFAYSANVGWIDLHGLTMSGITAGVRFPGNEPLGVAGSPLTLSAGTFGTEALSFQWFFNGAPIPGATGRTLTLASAQRFHSGAYSVVITRATGETFTPASSSLVVTAPPPNPARLVNLSTRAQALTGDDILIPGFVVAGTGTKRLLIRAVGPTLKNHPYNIASALENPRMVLKRLDASVYVDVDSNDDWLTNDNAADIAAAIDDLSAFEFEDDREAALLVDLAPGQYTVFADGVPSTGSGQGATGIAIVELYDAEPAVAGPATTLANISNRGFVGTGEAVMIPGFVISSGGPKTLLIRVVGPTLDGPPYNVPGTMADPKLTIYSGQAAILENDNWNDNPDAAHTADVAGSIGAFALVEGSADAAFVVTLPPGNYTVVGSAADGVSTGVVLVEVYVVP